MVSPDEELGRTRVVARAVTRPEAAAFLALDAFEERCRREWRVVQVAIGLVLVLAGAVAWFAHESRITELETIIRERR